MAFGDVFTDVGWANGNYITEVKQDQELANDRYLRDQVSVGPIINIAKRHQWNETTKDWDLLQYPAVAEYASTNQFRTHVVIGTTKYYTGSSFGVASAEDHGADIDISGLAIGRHDILIGISENNAALSDVTAWSGQIFRTQEMQKLSCWISRDGDSYSPGAGVRYRAWIEKATVVFHRETQGW